jgi:uncharacterized protein
MTRLVVNGVDVSMVHIASTPALRRKGLLGRSSFAEAMWFPGIKSVHTVRMQFAIDVAYVDRVGKVVRVQTMKPGRLGPWIKRAANVVEANAGAFQRWGLSVGAIVEVRA